MIPGQKLAFLGTPEVAARVLRSLLEAGHEIAVVVTGADKRRGRGSQLSPNPVKSLAQEAGIPVSHDIDDVVLSGADLGVVVAYGRIIPKRVLDELPMVNLHFSLLPRWRGAAPVERAILAGDSVTGVCVMQVAPELDAGDTYSCWETEIGLEETVAELRHRLSDAGSELLLQMLALPEMPKPVAQQGEVTYAAKITSDDLRLHWEQPAQELSRVVRVGRAWTTFRGHRLVISRTEIVDDDSLEPGELRADLVGTGNGALRLLIVQPAGRAQLEGTAWTRGARPLESERLGS